MRKGVYAEEWNRNRTESESYLFLTVFQIPAPASIVTEKTFYSIFYFLQPLPTKLEEIRYED